MLILKVSISSPSHLFPQLSLVQTLLLVSLQAQEEHEGLDS